MTGRLTAKLAALWKAVRTATGDDAYERYLEHWRAHHAQEGPPLPRKAFYRSEMQRRWEGVRRCC